MRTSGWLCCVACVAGVAFAGARSVEPDAARFKGLRAVIAHDGILPERVVIDDSTLATRLFTALLEAPAVGRTAAETSARPCIRLSFYYPSPLIAHLEPRELREDQADYQLTLYPATPYGPAMAGVFGRHVEVPAELLDRLAAVGLPATAPADADAPGC